MQETKRNVMNEEDLQRIKELRLMDDDFFSEALDGKIEAVEYILNTILECDDIKVKSTKAQVEYKSATKRSIILDIQAEDANGKIMDIEIQRSDRGSGVKRARFHSSMIDRTLLSKGEDFEDLVDTYVIFITENDKFGKGIPLYHIERRIEEMDYTLFGDGAHIIYVNSRKQDDTELGRIMHDLHCKKADEMHSQVLAKRVHELKETQKGVELMCHEMEKIYSEGMESGEKRGIEKGELKAKKETALSMAEEGMNVKTIARLVKVSEKDVQKWIDETLCVTK